MSILLALLGIAFVLLLGAAAIVTVPYVLYFHCHYCKHCGHRMEYRGLKGDDKNGHHLFHCPKCGAWEEVPKDVFLNKFLCDDLLETWGK